MTAASPASSRHCQGCGKPLPSLSKRPGRPQLNCNDSCKEEAKINRRVARALSLPEDTVVLPRHDINAWLDRQTQARCSIEDIITALHEGADPTEVLELAQRALDATRDAEQFRLNRAAGTGEG